MSLFVIFEIIEAIVNRLTVDDKYSFRIYENLLLLIQMQLSKK